MQAGKRLGQLVLFILGGASLGIAGLFAVYWLVLQPPAPQAKTRAVAVSAEPPPIPRVEDAACWFPVPADRTVRCGHLVAPETPGLSNGRVVRLPFVIFKSQHAGGEAPLVFLHGGPGEPAGLDPEGVARWWSVIDQSAWLRRQDLVAFDQRGAGLAEPSLKCPEMQAAGYQVFISRMTEAEADESWRRAAGACRQRLTAEGLPLESYNTASSVEDLAALIGGLGYSSWNLYGVSYGTRLALAFLRQHPGGTRSVILDSVYPLDIHSYVEATANANRAFDALFDDCAKRPACQRANPHLAESFRQLVQRAAASPLEVAVDGAPSQTAVIAAPLDAGKLVEVLFGGFYNWREIGLLPGVITAAARGDIGRLSPLANEALDTYRNGDFSYGLFLSTECHDEWSFDGPAAIDQAARNADIFRSFARTNLPVVACPIWTKASGDASFHRPVSSDIPVLLLAGDLDPITPPQWAARAAETLPHSFVVRFPGIGHGVLASHRCADRLAERFLNDPSKAPYDDCLIAVAEGPDPETTAPAARVPSSR